MVLSFKELAFFGVHTYCVSTSYIIIIDCYGMQLCNMHDVYAHVSKLAQAAQAAAIMMSSNDIIATVVSRCLMVYACCTITVDIHIVVLCL